jgi:hypothetical protein
LCDSKGEGRSYDVAAHTQAQQRGIVIEVRTDLAPQRLVAEGDVPAHVDRVLSKPPKLRELREAFARSFSGRVS